MSMHDDGELNQDEIDALLGIPTEKRSSIKVMTSFIQQGTVTGRTDASKGNISNTPKTSAETKMCPLCKTNNTKYVVKREWNTICGPGSFSPIVDEYWQCLGEGCGIRFECKK